MRRNIFQAEGKWLINKRIRYNNTGHLCRKNQSIILGDKDFPDAGKISGVRVHLSLS